MHSISVQKNTHHRNTRLVGIKTCARISTFVAVTNKHNILCDHADLPTFHHNTTRRGYGINLLTFEPDLVFQLVFRSYINFPTFFYNSQEKFRDGLRNFLKVSEEVQW